MPQSMQVSDRCGRFAFRDSAHGALRKTCAASYAFVGDYVCHGYENKIVESWIRNCNWRQGCRRAAYDVAKDNVFYQLSLTDERFFNERGKNIPPAH